MTNMTENSVVTPYSWKHVGPHLVLIDDGKVVFKIPVEDAQPIREALLYWFDVEMRDKSFFTADVLVALLNYIIVNEFLLQEYLDSVESAVVAVQS